MKEKYIRLKNMFVNNKILLAFIINVFFALFVLLFAEIKFETNDDNGMSQIGYGIYGKYSEFLVFINVFIGIINSFLMTIFPQIPWYTVLMLITLFVSYWVLSYVLLRINSNSIIYIFIMLTFFGYNTYSAIQFTKVASVATVAGIALLYYFIQEEKSKYGCIIVSTILLILGASYRFEMFCACTALMAGLLWYYLYNMKKSKSLKKSIKKIGIALIPFMFCVLVYAGNIIYCTQNKEIREYVEFNKYRAELTDYGWPEYEKNVDTYSELGITSDDLNMYHSWNFADPDVINTETVKKLVAVKEPLSKKDAISNFISWYPVKLLKYKWIVAFLFIQIISIILVPKRILLHVYNWGVLSIFELYFTYRQRYLKERVDVGVFLALFIVIVVVLLCDMKKREGEKKYNIVKCPALSMFLFIFLIQTVYFDRIDKETYFDADDCKKVIQLISSDKEHMYIYAVGDAWFMNEIYGVWDVPPKGVASNIYALGGWGTYSPTSESVKQGYNIRNPFKDIVNRDDVYIVNSNIDQYVEYVQRHYNKNAYAVRVKQIGGLNCYNIRDDKYTITDKIEKNNPDELYTDINFYLDEEEFVVDGYIYMEGIDSYSGVCVAEFENRRGKTEYYNLSQYEDDLFVDYDKRFSRYRISIDNPEDYVNCRVIYNIHGKAYNVFEQKLD